jgi:hypothetical protein
MPMLMMDVGKMGMAVPKGRMLMLVHMRFGSVPPLAMLVLMMLIVLMRVRMRMRMRLMHVCVEHEPVAHRGRTELLSWHGSARDGQQTFRGLIQINIHPRLR